MKKLLALFMCIVMCVCSAVVPTSADNTRDISLEESYAAALKQLGLFKGVSDTDFDLDRAPTRIEALVMLIRVLGKEQDALTGTWSHPFVDVPSWADAYVGYAYANGLTKGISATEFGSGDATAATYLTFVLRALGYSDANDADFTWNDPYSLAKSAGVLDDTINTDSFWRADVAAISYLALSAKLKDSDNTLADKLTSSGAFTADQYTAAMGEKHDEQTTKSFEEAFDCIKDYVIENGFYLSQNDTFQSYKTGTYEDGTITLRIIYIPATDFIQFTYEDEYSPFAGYQSEDVGVSIGRNGNCGVVYGYTTPTTKLRLTALIDPSTFSSNTVLVPDTDSYQYIGSIEDKEAYNTIAAKMAVYTLALMNDNYFDEIGVTLSELGFTALVNEFEPGTVSIPTKPSEFPNGLTDEQISASNVLKNFLIENGVREDTDDGSVRYLYYLQPSDYSYAIMYTDVLDDGYWYISFIMQSQSSDDDCKNLIHLYSNGVGAVHYKDSQIECAAYIDPDEFSPESILLGFLTGAEENLQGGNEYVYRLSLNTLASCYYYIIYSNELGITLSDLGFSDLTVNID